jgi:hypothetical protein
MFETTNKDPSNGIAYGVISQNSLMPEVLDDLIQNSEDLVYEESKTDFLNELKNAIKEVLDNNYIHHEDKDIDIDYYLDLFNNQYENDFHAYYFKDKDYEIRFFDDLNAMYILKSPYVCMAPLCSPCCPGAGDLNSTNGIDAENNSMGSPVECYCLPNDFFEDDKAPYSYKRIEEREE